MANVLSRMVLDTWSALSHKEELSDKRSGRPSALVPGWADGHQRRLTAYRIRQAYLDNVARWFLPSMLPDDERADRREYGDAALVRDTIQGALMGDDQSIVVEGAEDDPPEGAAGDFVSPEAERQEWLVDWAQRERLPLKMIETERNAVGLGDGVLAVGWSNKRRRPVLRCFDPDSYFPVLDTGSEDEYPRTVHVAWEEDAGEDVRTIHRITWQLVDLDVPVRRRYQGTDEDPASVTCLLTEATWKLEDFGSRKVDDLDWSKATFATNEDGSEIRDLDLEIDFVPVIHMPNTVALLAHFGRSVLDVISQILDDLAGADSDLAKAAGLAGSPPIVLSGEANDITIRWEEMGSDGTSRPLAGDGETRRYGPGDLWKVGKDGKLDVLDTSTMLDALLKYVEFLLKRLSVNARVPEAALGRITGEAKSGVHFALMFGPLHRLVREMRLVRAEKYPLLLKFVQRLAILGGTIEGPVMAADIVMGSFLPSDRAAVVTEVKELLQAKAISTTTAVSMLIEAGYPIDDAAEEVRRIQEENFEAAVQLLEATGNEQAVADYLGREVSAAPPVPALNLPAPPPSGQ